MGDRFYDGALPLDILVLGGFNSDDEARIRLRFVGLGASEKIVYLSNEQAELLADLMARNAKVPEADPTGVEDSAPTVQQQIDMARVAERLAERQQIDMNAVTTPDDPQVDRDSLAARQPIYSDWTPDQLRHLQAYGIDEALLQGHLANVHGVPPSDMPRGLEARRKLHEELTA